MRPAILARPTPPTVTPARPGAPAASRAGASYRSDDAGRYHPGAVRGRGATTRGRGDDSGETLRGVGDHAARDVRGQHHGVASGHGDRLAAKFDGRSARSEERRVGKE